MNIFSRNKLFIFLIILIAIAAVVLVAVYFFVPQKITLTPGHTFQKPVSQKLLLEDEVVISNIYNNDKYTYESGATVIEKNRNYQAIFNPETNRFTITITSADFDIARKVAEQEFLTKLNIDQATACKLDVVINTLPQLNPEESQSEYRLSFCN